MSDQQQRTQWALDLFREFIRNWTPMATHAQLYQNDEGQCGGCSCYDPDEDDKLHGCLGCLVDTADHNCGFKPAVIPRVWANSANRTT